MSRGSREVVARDLSVFSSGLTTLTFFSFIHILLLRFILAPPQYSVESVLVSTKGVKVHGYVLLRMVWYGQWPEESWGLVPRAMRALVGVTVTDVLCDVYRHASLEVSWFKKVVSLVMARVGSR